MSSFFQTIKSLFASDEKRFTSLLLEELETSSFINIRKLDSRLSLDKRYICIRKLQSSKKISGVFLSDKSFFFSIPDEELTEIRETLKKRGQLVLTPFKDRWLITEKILSPFLMHLEKGLLGHDKFYTLTFLKSEILSQLKNVETYNLEDLVKSYGVEKENIMELVEKMIGEKELFGVLQNQHLYVDSSKFEEELSEFLEDNFEDSLEMDFNLISNKLKVSEKDIERFLVNYVEKNPHKLVIYPLEKKIRFKS